MKRRTLIGGLAALPLGASAQGFAGMGAAVEGFENPVRRAFVFPHDHGPHPTFRIEWWYVTANLTMPDGTPCGIQWTLFRSAIEPREGEMWESPQLWMAHMGITTPDAHYAAERLARGGIGQAGVEAKPFHAWIDEWHMRGATLSDVSLSARGMDAGYDLRLVAEKPFVPQGDAGYSVKSREGQASHYYSQPFYRAEGVLMLPGGDVEVTGRAWLDREWSSQPLSEGQTGWDWFSLHLDEGAGAGSKLMGFRLRDAGGDFTSATWIAPDGMPTPQPPGALRVTPLETVEVAGRRIPVVWRVELPARELDVTVTAVNPQAWMAVSVSYWEGPVTVAGSHRGEGYLEMTGYE